MKLDGWMKMKEKTIRYVWLFVSLKEFCSRREIKDKPSEEVATTHNRRNGTTDNRDTEKTLTAGKRALYFFFLDGIVCVGLYSGLDRELLRIIHTQLCHNDSPPSLGPIALAKPGQGTHRQ